MSQSPPSSVLSAVGAVPALAAGHLAETGKLTGIQVMHVGSLAGELELNVILNRVE